MEGEMRVGQLSRYGAWTALNMTITKIMEYLLRAITISENECTHMMAHLLEAGLS